LIQANNAGLRNEIYVIYKDGVPIIVSSQFFVDGNAQLDGTVSLALNSSQIAAAIRQLGSAVSVTLLTGSSVSTRLKDGDIIDTDDSAPCDATRVVARARISPKSISAVFSLEQNPNANSAACIKDPLNVSASSVQVAAIVLGVLIPLAAIAAGVSIFIYQRKRTLKMHRDMQKKLSQANRPPARAPDSSTTPLVVSPAPTTSVPKTSGWTQAKSEEVELRNIE
jgi:hypothetical protein